MLHQHVPAALQAAQVQHILRHSCCRLQLLLYLLQAVLGSTLNVQVLTAAALLQAVALVLHG
jgi:hypothetical protein